MEWLRTLHGEFLYHWRGWLRNTVIIVAVVAGIVAYGLSS